MTAHIELLPSGHHFTAESQETILEAALRAGLSPSYSCGSGSCGECRARLIEGRLGETQHCEYRFSEAERAQGYFLMCGACADGGDLVIEADEAGSADDIPHQKVTTRVHKLERLGDDVMVMHLRTPRSETLRFLAGQYVTLRIGDQVRNKSVASCPCNAMNLQFHFRRAAGDAFSDHIFGSLKAMTPVEIEGPGGSFTLDETSGRPAILLAYDTGFAPIKSLVEHAIALEYAQPLQLYWVVGREGDHYLNNYCRSWVDALDSFTYTPIVGGFPPTDGGQDAAGYNLLIGAERIVADHPSLAGFNVYVNGPDHIMADTRALLLAHGLPEAQLRIDHLPRL
jgi:CDP-4-dehydro-6-deoxyglucose reductase